MTFKIKFNQSFHAECVQGIPSIEETQRALEDRICHVKAEIIALNKEFTVRIRENTTTTGKWQIANTKQRQENDELRAKNEGLCDQINYLMHSLEEQKCKSVREMKKMELAMSTMHSNVQRLREDMDAWER